MIRTRSAAAAALVALLSGPAAAFEVTSSSLGADGALPDRYFGNVLGCAGTNISPEIAWSDPPEGTKSFVVTLFDPTAPTPSGWWHWMVANVPADATNLPEGAGSITGIGMPPGAVQGRGDVGMASYQGPCPPQDGSRHSYLLSVYALGVETLPVDRGASGALISLFASRNAIATATLDFTATRPPQAQQPAEADQPTPPSAPAPEAQ